MRLSASLGLVIIVGLFGSCIQRTDRCLTSGTDYQCPSDQFCKPSATDPTVGQCVASECTPSMNPSGCSPDKPVCSAQGRCVECDPANVTQCATLYPALPYCVNKMCVACSATTNQGCENDPVHPACDSKTNTCRTCELHSECPSKVCVKDNTLSGLTSGKALSMGMCVPKTRILIVDETTCGAGCSLQTELNNASVDSPYVLVNNYSQLSSAPILVKPIAGLPELHIVTSTADTSPAKLPAVKASLNYFSLTTPALTVAQGASVTIEGLAIVNGGTGVLCDSGAVPAATSVKLIRSLLTQNNLAIQTKAKCQLTLDQTWVGTFPQALYGVNNIVGGNAVAMTLDSTQFDIINSVFVHNFNTPPPTFGGITVTDSLNMGGHIVNSTFYRHEVAASPANALAINCKNIQLAQPLTIFNTLFVNSAGNIAAGQTYVDPKCLGTGSLGYIATDQSPVPAGPGNVSGISDSLFTSIGLSTYDLHPLANAPATVISGGIATTFNNVTPPAVDMDRTARSKTTVTIGAFEVAH